MKIELRIISVVLVSCIYNTLCILIMKNINLDKNILLLMLPFVFLLVDSKLILNRTMQISIISTLIMFINTVAVSMFNSNLLNLLPNIVIILWMCERYTKINKVLKGNLNE